MGHSFEIKQSLIDHHEAGDGVFIKTKNKQSILPGTLLGFFPGVICEPNMQYPERGNHKTFESILKYLLINTNTFLANQIGVRNFLNRFDNFWIDSDRKLPFPTKMGLSLFEHTMAFDDYKNIHGIGNLEFEEIEHEYLLKNV